MLKLLFLKASLIFSLLSISASVCHANDYLIDFVGSVVVISYLDGRDPQVIDVKHLMDKDADTIVKYVLGKIRK